MLLLLENIVIFCLSAFAFLHLNCKHKMLFSTLHLQAAEWEGEDSGCHLTVLENLVHRKQILPSPFSYRFALSNS